MNNDLQSQKRLFRNMHITSNDRFGRPMDSVRIVRHWTKPFVILQINNWIITVKHRILTYWIKPIRQWQVEW